MPMFAALSALLQQRYFETSVAQWLAAAALTVGVTALLRGSTRLVAARLSHTAPHTPSLVDDVVLQMARRTFFSFQLAMGVAAASWILSVPEHWDARIRTTVVLLAMLQAGVWGSGIVDYLVIALIDRRGGTAQDAVHRTGRAMLRFMGLTVVWSSVLLLSLEHLGFSITTLIAGLGVTGIAVALATQQIFGDLFASVCILLDKPFLIGDYIVVDAFMGTVEHIGVRSTRVRGLGGEAIVFANSELSKGRLRNYATMAERRIAFNFGLRADTSVDDALAVSALLREIIAQTPKTRVDRVHWAAFTENALWFEAVYYVLDGDYAVYMDKQQSINAALLRGLRQRHIELAVGTPVRLMAPAPTAYPAAAR